MSKDETQIIDNAVAEAGAYDVIRKRLNEQGSNLQTLAQQLNQQRLSEFGGVEIQAIARTRVRTENNCIARDIVRVGDQLLFGYNVFIGLKKETHIDDVFALFELVQDGDTFELQAADIQKSFLADSRFQGDFDELYRYYKESRLVQLRVIDGKLLAGFQVGERATDIRVFRWAISADGKQFDYIDNRGERDIELPTQYDFEWIETSRDDFVHGRHPHVNIADTVFVETINGELTVKVEDNTEDGLGIYSEQVQEANQSLDDASISYAKVGNLILLAVTPYKEEKTRYLVFNSLTQQVERIDAIGQSCIGLPEGHGIIFPGGIYLDTGESKSFPDDINGLTFKRMIRSPNGEDVLYVFYEQVEGKFGLFSYNLITRSLQNPIFGNGYGLFPDGKLIVFSAEAEPTRVHPMQLWQTSYISAEFASEQPESTTELGKIGNSELVRGISDLFSIHQLIEKKEVSMRHYEELREATRKIFDMHYWLDSSARPEIAATLREVGQTSELVIDEFEKVQSIQLQSSQALSEAKSKQRTLLSRIQTTTWETAEQFVASILEIRKQRGHIATIKSYRYINVEELEQLEQALTDAETQLGTQTTEFLTAEDSLQSYSQHTAAYAEQIDMAQTNAEIRPIIESIGETTAQLDLLSELITTLKIDDTTVRTRIVDTISEVYANLNQTKARGTQKQKGLGSEEAIAQFSAQFKLFSQSITNALSASDTPDKCDEQLAKLLVQLEDLESQFSDYDQFLGDIMDKREEIYESFEAHKQSLMEARQRRAQTLSDSAARILNSIEKRSLKLANSDDLNTYFASDALVLKTDELIEQLRALDAQINADDVQSRFKGIKEQAIRALRDKTDIYEDGGKVIKLGPKHKFSVNQQELDLTIIPRNDQLYFHLIGTDFYEPVSDPKLADAQQYWSMSLESETPDIYRAETLAFLVLDAARQGQHELSMKGLYEVLKKPDELTKLLRDFSTPLYKHGYQKGIHDFDASLILQAILPAITAAELLTFEPSARALATVFWHNLPLLENQDAKELQADWSQRAISSRVLRELFTDDQALRLLAVEIHNAIERFLATFPIPNMASSSYRAAEYLVEHLAEHSGKFIQSRYARDLQAHFDRSLNSESSKLFRESIKRLAHKPDQAWSSAHAWLTAVSNSMRDSHPEVLTMQRYIPEVIGQLITGVDTAASSAKLELEVEGLLGEHNKISQQTLSFSLDEYLQRMEHHQRVTLPAYRDYLTLRSDVMKSERNKLKLESFKAKPLSSFVRNRLVNESYLPLIGDNLAKQMGTIGDTKRTDLMGLLMMISPPGYGKTTLMEYVANRLGLIFMKINCPSLGHDVTSLDPEQAPNSTARQELEKINLAFEMGNNVMLYLDDIQHTHPEFLQKYISLCDGTRRIDGVWRGQTKTYDMRGKKFCVVMAGNPYTESGEVFKVPDMLANRADIYNLGDILGGMDEQFGLSYIENALTSNAVLAPLATRDMQDVYRLIDMAKGKNVAATELSHQYSGAEINEISSVFEKLFVIQSLILKVNQQYIASAAQADRYRVEPPFKLQGSYRNMNKMAEKVSAVMNHDELMQLIEDHYQGEAQLLTNGTEQNLLKLAELRGNLTPEETVRWEQIRADFKRSKALGGEDIDGSTRIANQMMDLVARLDEINESVASSVAASKQQHASDGAAQSKLAEQRLELEAKQTRALLKSLASISEALGTQAAPTVEVINQPSDKMINTLDIMAAAMETSIQPLLLSMEKKMDIDLRTLEKIHDLTQRIQTIKDEASLTTRTTQRKTSKTQQGSSREATKQKPNKD
ncbi:DNA repair ATPase [Arenicella xantha]|uniref:ATPase family protein associated with various cellular activities (AAA) n=1 Tax=Arenicella xantha TaxID=644221 RepID=A0A395JJQ8_9GAMM|nr:DNA repair ATPase [Arenicella xantha]RBP51016.1 ATPase family protein associated with various cellular activities (AAA) [Arenicella xantha]